MENLKRFGGSLALALATIVGTPGAQAASSSGPAQTATQYAETRAGSLSVVQPSSLSGANGSEPSTIALSKPPLPHGAVDLAAAPAAAHLDRVLLLLEPSTEQKKGLDQELADQQNPSSSEYHHWLTPAAFGDKYANTQADVEAVAAWLRTGGFEVAPLPLGRGWIEFSGTVGQLEQAFQTHVHTFAVGGGTRLALADSIAVPAGLRPLIHGLVSLDGVITAAAMTSPRAVASSAADLAALGATARAEALTPKAAAQLLHLDTLHADGLAGGGETVAIAARSNVRTADIAAFRSAFGLPVSTLQVMVNGADPGRNGDEAVAELMASWAGAAAPGAQIVLAPAATTSATDGVDLSLAAIVDGDVARTVAVGFSACEASLSEAHQAFYAALYRQAAGEGIAVIAAAGDSGASACHAAGGDAAVTAGYGVNALASTPWNTAVGTAALAETGSGSGGAELAGWSPRNPADPSYAGGGGASALYSVPNWQPLPAQNVAAAEPGGNFRLLPDVALPAAVDSGVNPGLVFCYSGSASAAVGTATCNAVRSGGSSAAAAMFAGIAAIVAEKNGAQGNLAPRLYQLSRRAGIFEDVQQGSARLSCSAGSPDCDASGQIGFSAAAGYDLATGLGSPDAEKLVSAWATPDANGTGAAGVLLTVTPAAQNTTYNPSAQITFSATVSSQTGGATPTGTVTFSDATSSGTITIGGSAATLDSSGKASVTVPSGSAGQNGLSVGGNNVTAQYSGDATYAAVNSTPPFVVTIAKSQTTPAISAPATVASGASFTATVTITAGTPAAGTLPPGGAVTMAVDGVAVATANLSTTGGVTSATFTLTAPTTSGSHNLQATYPGDANYSSSVATVAFTISKGATVTALTATPGVLTPGTTETLTASVAPLSSTTTTFTITGTVAFYDGTVLLGTATLSSNSATLSGVALSTATAHSLTAVYSGDASWGPSTSNPLILTPVLLADSVTLTVSPATAAPGQVVTLTATVTPATAPATTSEQNPTGNVIFYNGTTILATVALTAGPNHTATATLLNATLPSGTDVLTAYYVGDSFYAAATSNAITISVQDFSIAPAGTNPPTNLNIIKGSSGSATFVVAGLGGFAGQIQVVCAVPTQDDMTCQASPQQVTPTATVSFTVQTFAAGGTTSARENRVPLWPRAAGGTAFAALVFFLLPFGKRARVFTDRARRLFVLLLWLAGLGAAGIGCNSSTTLPQDSGTPLGVATLKITAAANIDNTVISHSVYLTVNVLPPGSAAAIPRATRRR